jgi:uncharacterized 2Fe-2S/4Fe-4S cluster protein (DUF4445 family)
MSSLIVEICKVEEIIPIPNKDRIEQVKIKGWYCITQKDVYNVGDLIVFIPPDSIMTPSIIEKYNHTSNEHLNNSTEFVPNTLVVWNGLYKFENLGI